MAERLQVSPKTIHRDLDFLRDRMLVDLHIERRPAGRFRYVAKDPTRGALPLVRTLAAIR
jgi:predicted DNA-binding transcriptional regulator YafY